MAGYTVQWGSLAGDKIDTELFDSEYTIIGDAFNTTSGHTHSGNAGEGAPIPLISSVLKGTAVEIDDSSPADAKIIFNLADTLGIAKIPVLNLIKLVNDGTEAAVIPVITTDLGGDGLSGNPGYRNVYSGAVITSGLTLSDFLVNQIVDDDLMADADAPDGATSLATQQSIKAFVDASVAASPGIFTQRVFNSRLANVAMTDSGATVGYLSAAITVTAGSSVHIHSFIQGNGIGSASITGRVTRTTLTAIGNGSVSPDYIVASDGTTSFQGGVGRVDFDDGAGSGLDAGDYTYEIEIEIVGANGDAEQATIMLIEETA